MKPVMIIDADPFELFAMTDADRAQAAAEQAAAVAADDARNDAAEAEIAAFLAEQADDAEQAEADRQALLAQLRAISGIQDMSPAEYRIWCD